MNNTQSTHLTSLEEPVPPHKTDWLTVLQLVFSILTFLLYFGIGVSILLFSSLDVLNSLPRADTALNGNMALIGVVSFFFAFIALISIILSLGRLARKGAEPTPRKAGILFYFVILLLPLIIFLVKTLYSNPDFQTWLLAVLTVLALAVPVVWYMRIGSGKLWGRHAKRDAGLVTFSLGFSTFFIMLLEIVVLLIAMIALGVVVASNPDIMDTLQQMLPNLQTLDTDPEELLKLLQPILTNPAVISSIILFTAFVVPLTEELFKTMGVWLLLGTGISAAEGWVAGLMSGAGFAFVESLLNGLQVMQVIDFNEWLVGILSRAGASLIHVFLGGLLGWAFAKTWQDRKALRVVGMFLLVVHIHGLWNGIAISAGLAALTQGLTEPTWIYYPLGAIFVALFVMLVVLSHRITKPETA